MTRKTSQHRNTAVETSSQLWNQVSGFAILVVLAAFVIAHVRSFEQSTFLAGGVGGLEAIIVGVASAMVATVGVTLTSQTNSRRTLSRILLAVAVAIPVIDLGAFLAGSLFA